MMENSPHRFTRGAPRIVADDQSDRDNAKRTEAALVIWQSATPAGGTLAENYLVSRGLYLPPPPTLRFHPGLKHPSGGIWPAMVALVTHGGDGKPVGIHRTFLARDGNGKAPVEPTKMMLGRPTQADILINVAKEGAPLFHTPDGTGYADIEVNGHRETWAI